MYNIGTNKVLDLSNGLFGNDSFIIQWPNLVYLDKTSIEVAQHQIFVRFEHLDLTQRWRNPAKTLP